MKWISSYQGALRIEEATGHQPGRPASTKSASFPAPLERRAVHELLFDPAGRATDFPGVGLGGARRFRPVTNRTDIAWFDPLGERRKRRKCRRHAVPRRP